MPKQSLATLKNWFKKGFKPLEAQFVDVFDSFFHKDGAIPISNITDLLETLNSLAPSQAITDLRNELKGGVAVGGDTLKKLYDLINAISITLGAVLTAGNNAGGLQIKNLADPTLAQDADTKAARDAAIASLNTQLLGGAGGGDDTLKKLADKIVAINAIIGSSSADGDSIVNTVSELLAVFSAYPEATDIFGLLNGKVATADVYNALDLLVSGKVLDARQGKALKDLIDANTTAIGLRLLSSDKASQANSETAADPVLANRNDTKWMTPKGFRWAFDSIVLNGLSTADASNVSAADSVLVAFGKLQARTALVIANQGIDVNTLGAIGDGVTDCTQIIQDAINNNVGKKILIGRSPAEVYLIDKPISIPSDSVIELNGTLKIANGNTRSLTANVVNGDTTISVANASTYFKVGQKIKVSDDNQAVAGGGAWKTRKIGNTNVITAVNTTTITCQYAFASIPGGSFTTAANAKVAQNNSLLIIDGVSNVIITGIGVIDGNEANQYNVIGNLYNNTAEDTRGGCGIVLNNCSQIKIVGSLTIKSTILHGLSTADLAFGQSANFITLSGITFDSCHEKSLVGLNLKNSTISFCRNINGVDEGDIIMYNGCSNVSITNCISSGNRRYGIACTGQNNTNISVSNCFSVTSRNRESVYNFYFQNQLFGLLLNNLSVSAEEMDSTWTRSTVTATITTPVAHNLTNGQLVWISITSSSAAIPLGSYVATVTSATTFTIVCLNAGFGTGNLSYLGAATSGCIVINSCLNVDAKNLSIYNHPLASIGLSISAGTVYAATANDVRIDGLIIKDSTLLPSKAISIGSAVRGILIQNFSIDNVYRVFSDGAGNGLIKFQNGSVGLYSNALFETDNLKFIFSNVSGIVTENASSATIASGRTSVTINHLMSRTPLAQNIRLLPINNLGNATKYWVSDINSSNFKINVDVDPGANTAKFRWNIETYEGDVTAEAVHTNNYTSDFSAGVDGWASTRLTAAGNTDGVSDGTTSLNDVLKVYSDNSNNTHEISKTVAFVGKQNRITFKYFIPAGNTNVNGIRVYGNAFTATVLGLTTGNVTLGQWVEVTSAYFTPTSTTMYFRLMKTFTTAFVGANSAADDIVYIKDIVVEYLP
jgi:hypothetical protein